MTGKHRAPATDLWYRIIGYGTLAVATLALAAMAGWIIADTLTGA